VGRVSAQAPVQKIDVFSFLNFLSERFDRDSNGREESSQKKRSTSKKMPQPLTPWQEIIRDAAKETSIDPLIAKKVMRSALQSIIRLTAEGKIVRFVGFGAFSAKKRKTSTGRNPRTGELIQIPENTRPAFRPGQDFKAALNPKTEQNKKPQKITQTSKSKPLAKNAAVSATSNKKITKRK
jgi:DNA-binding protein HU-beta